MPPAGRSHRSSQHVLGTREWQLDGVEVRGGLRPRASTRPAGSSSPRDPRRLGRPGPKATRTALLEGAPGRRLAGGVRWV